MKIFKPIVFKIIATLLLAFIFIFGIKESPRLMYGISLNPYFATVFLICFFIVINYIIYFHNDSDFIFNKKAECPDNKIIYYSIFHAAKWIGIVSVLLAKFIHF